MINAILGKKLKMESAFDRRGRFVPLTVIEAGPCPVIQVKTQEKDGYLGVQLGFSQRKKVKKPLLGHLKKGGIQTLPRFIKEAKLTEGQETPKTGDVIKVGDVLSRGDLVSISGTSKGKGFAGVVKRWGFAGGPATHGQSDRQRAPGSIGQTTTPGRVMRGKKMAGRMGGERVTVNDLEVFDVDTENNLLKVKGSVPGARNGFIFILKTGEKKTLKEELKLEEGETEAAKGTPRDDAGEPRDESREKEEVKAEGEELKEEVKVKEQKENPPSPEATTGQGENAETNKDAQN